MGVTANIILDAALAAATTVGVVAALMFGFLVLA